MKGGSDSGGGGGRCRSRTKKPHKKQTMKICFSKQSFRSSVYKPRLTLTLHILNIFAFHYHCLSDSKKCHPNTHSLWLSHPLPFDLYIDSLLSFGFSRLQHFDYNHTEAHLQMLLLLFFCFVRSLVWWYRCAHLLILIDSIWRVFFAQLARICPSAV